MIPLLYKKWEKFKKLRALYEYRQKIFPIDHIDYLRIVDREKMLDDIFQLLDCKEISTKKRKK